MQFRDYASVISNIYADETDKNEPDNVAETEAWAQEEVTADCSKDKNNQSEGTLQKRNTLKAKKQVQHEWENDIIKHISGLLHYDEFFLQSMQRFREFSREEKMKVEKNVDGLARQQRQFQQPSRSDSHCRFRS